MIQTESPDKKTKEDRTSTTRLIFAAKSAGFTFPEIKQLTLGQLLSLLDLRFASTGGETDVREATQIDINRLLG